MIRRGRDGEVLEVDEEDDDELHRCVGGWVGEDDDGRPLPCPTCKPWTTKPRRSR